MYLPHTHAVAVKGVEVTAVNGTSATVSWNVLIFPDLAIDYYTVVYSQLYYQQNGEKSAVFLPPATSGLITHLDTNDIYQFQVFATVTEDGRTLNGERSSSVHFTRPCKNCSYIFTDA